MEAELKRLVMRSPFRVRVEAPRREGDATLLYPFEPHVAWVAATYHRTSSRIAWDLWTSPATRLEPLFEDLVPLVAGDDRLDALRPRDGTLRLTVDVRAVDDFEAGPLQVRGTVKNAVIEGLGRRGIEAEVDEERPDATLVVRRSGLDGARRTLVALDLGGGARHRRGERVAMVEAPLRETLAAQLVMMSRWDARSEPLVDPMAGGGTIVVEAAHLAVGHRVRRPDELPRIAAFDGLPREAPDLFTGTVPQILASDEDQALIAPIIGNLRAAGLTGHERETSLVVRRGDVRDLSPEFVAEALPHADMSCGVIVANPPYGHRLGGDEEALRGLYADMGDAFARFRGWRASIFVANPEFAEAFGHHPSVTKPASNAQLRGWFLVYDF
jgi:putative N6-adenine-specific DNA methylase